MAKEYQDLTVKLRNVVFPNVRATKIGAYKNVSERSQKSQEYDYKEKALFTIFSNYGVDFITENINQTSQALRSKVTERRKTG
jgi:hypothetical protein